MTRPGRIPQAREDARRRRQFLARLRKAGWTRIGGDAAVYQHPDGATFNCDEFRDGQILWRVWADKKETPPTTEET